MVTVRLAADALGRARLQRALTGGVMVIMVIMVVVVVVVMAGAAGDGDRRRCRCRPRRRAHGWRRPVAMPVVAVRFAAHGFRGRRAGRLLGDHTRGEEGEEGGGREAHFGYS